MTRRRTTLTPKQAEERSHERKQFWLRAVIVGLLFTTVATVVGGLSTKAILDQTKASQIKTVKELSSAEPKAPLTLDQTGVIHSTDKCIAISGTGSEESHWVLWSAVRQNGLGAALIPVMIDTSWVDNGHWSVPNLAVGPDTTQGPLALTVTVFYLPASTSAILASTSAAADDSSANTWIQIPKIPDDAVDAQSVQVERNGGSRLGCG